MTRNKNSSNMLRDLVLKKDTQINIARKYGYSESYISQIAKQIRQLKYKPKIKNDELICFKCEKESDQFDIHHNKENPLPIAIVCHTCNIRLENNELIYEEERKKQVLLKYLMANTNEEITAPKLFHIFGDEFNYSSMDSIRRLLIQLKDEKIIKREKKGAKFIYTVIEEVKDLQKSKLIDTQILKKMIPKFIEYGITLESTTEKEDKRIMELIQICL